MLPDLKKRATQVECKSMKLWTQEVYFTFCFRQYRDFPCGPVVRLCSSNAGDLGSIPGSGRFPGERNGNPLQYSCLENPTDRGAWQAPVRWVARVGHDLATKPPPPRQGPNENQILEWFVGQFFYLIN